MVSWPFAPPCRPLNSCFPFRGVTLNAKHRFDPDGFRVLEYRAMDNCRNLAPKENGVALEYAAIKNGLALVRSVVCCCWSNRNLHCGLAIKNESKGIDCRNGPAEVRGVDRGSILGNKKGAHYERLSFRRVYVG